MNNWDSIEKILSSATGPFALISGTYKQIVKSLNLANLTSKLRFRLAALIIICCFFIALLWLIIWAGKNSTDPQKPVGTIEEVLHTSISGKSITHTDTLDYELKVIKDTIYITPTSRMLDQIKTSKVVRAYHLIDYENDLLYNLPQLDLKITNNSKEAILLNEIDLVVDSSFKKNNVLFVVSGVSNIGFKNIGWSDAKNVKIDFSIMPYKKYKGWQTGPYDKHFFYANVLSSTRNEDASYIAYNIAEQLHLSQKAFQYGAIKNERPVYMRAFRTFVGDYDEGGMAYGTILYSDTDGMVKSQKFETWFEISGGYGGGLDVNAHYGLFLKSEGRNYLVDTLITQSIKSGESDRFSLALASDQSSKHFFRLMFDYNGREMKFPYVFCLDYFTTPFIKKYTEAEIDNRNMRTK